MLHDVLDQPAGGEAFPLDPMTFLVYCIFGVTCGLVDNRYDQRTGRNFLRSLAVMVYAWTVHTMALGVCSSLLA